MLRLVIAVLCAISVQNIAAQTSRSSDPVALSMAQKSIAALTSRMPIADVVLNANVIRVLGSDYETGTGTFSAKGANQSRVDLDLSGGKLSEIRALSNGVPRGAGKKHEDKAVEYAGHNCWTDAAWFFPSLSSLTQTANPRFVFAYIGPEKHNGLQVQHIRVFQNLDHYVASLSTMEFYLDPSSFLPLAIAFQSHPDNDMNTNMATEIRFANYRDVSGLQVPYHFQKLINGCVVLDATVTSVSVNTGLLDSSFLLQ